MIMYMILPRKIGTSEKNYIVELKVRKRSQLGGLIHTDKIRIPNTSPKVVFDTFEEARDRMVEILEERADRIQASLDDIRNDIKTLNEQTECAPLEQPVEGQLVQL